MADLRASVTGYIYTGQPTKTEIVGGAPLLSVDFMLRNSMDALIIPEAILIF